MQPSSHSIASVTEPPLFRAVEFDIKPVMQRYSSCSSISKTSQLTSKVSDKIQSKSRCALFFYNVPRSSITLALPGFMFLFTGACLVATKNPYQDWFSDGVLAVAFVFLVVGGMWSSVALAFWIAVWFLNKPSLLPKNLNKLPKNIHSNPPSVLNTKEKNSSVNGSTNSFDDKSQTNQGKGSFVHSGISEPISPFYSAVTLSSFIHLHTSTYNRNISHDFFLEIPNQPQNNINKK